LGLAFTPGFDSSQEMNSLDCCWKLEGSEKWVEEDIVSTGIWQKGKGERSLGRRVCANRFTYKCQPTGVNDSRPNKKKVQKMQGKKRKEVDGVVV